MLSRSLSVALKLPLSSSQCIHSAGVRFRNGLGSGFRFIVIVGAMNKRCVPLALHLGARETTQQRCRDECVHVVALGTGQPDTLSYTVKHQRGRLLYLYLCTRVVDIISSCGIILEAVYQPIVVLIPPMTSVQLTPVCVSLFQGQRRPTNLSTLA